MSKQHSFNINIAEKYGVYEAIILQNIAFWIEKNIANDNNFIDGDYWSYNSYEAFEQLFPYLKLNTIKRVIRRLEELKIIKSRNDLNKSTLDKTKWYAFEDMEILRDLINTHLFNKYTSVKKITIECEKNNIHSEKNNIHSEKNNHVYIDTDNKHTDNKPYIKKNNKKNRLKILEKLVLRALKRKKLLSYRNKVNISTVQKDLRRFKLNLKDVKLVHLASSYAEYIANNRNYAKRLNAYIIAYIEGNLSDFNQQGTHNYTQSGNNGNFAQKSSPRGVNMFNIVDEMYRARENMKPSGNDIIETEVV